MDDTERLEQIEAELIQTRLKQIDEHIKALEQAKALEAATASAPAKAPQPAQKNEVVEGVTCKHNAPWIVTNKYSKTQNDRTIHG